MSLEHAILGFLAAGPQTGYDLKTRCFDGTLSHAWTADQAQIYRTLDRLLDRGLVTSELIPQRGKPDRRVYSITATGREALDASMQASIDIPSPRDPLLLRLHFAGELPPEDLARILSDLRDRYAARVAALKARLEAESSMLPDDAGRLRILALEHAIEREEREIEFVSQSIESSTLGSRPTKRGSGAHR